MLHPPHGLADAALHTLLGDAWGLEAATLEYRAIGFRTWWPGTPN